MHHHDKDAPSKDLPPQAQDEILQLERRVSELRRVTLQAINVLRACRQDTLADELLNKMLEPTEIKKRDTK
jgi:hypothetical protein